MPQSIFRHHGGVRGADTPHLSLQFEGRFGRMFRALPHAAFSTDALMKLGAAMTSPAEDAPTPETEVDAEENQGISAGYTYLGQFIDHDLTFDPASSLMKQNDPEALVDFRTPRFDLDYVYGRGPETSRTCTQSTVCTCTSDGADRQPERPEHARPAAHTPRNGGPARALIGDPRNDENVIVSQLQGIMLRFHNRMVGRTNATVPTLGEVQRIVRWHYQWVVLHDFLPTVVGQEIVFAILPHLKSRRIDPGGSAAI